MWLQKPVSDRRTRPSSGAPRPETGVETMRRTAPERATEVPSGSATDQFWASGREKPVSERRDAGVFHAFVGTCGSPVRKADDGVPEREPTRPPPPRDGVRPGPVSKDSKSMPPGRKFRFRGLGAQIHPEHAPASRKPASGRAIGPIAVLPDAAGSIDGSAQSTIAIFANTTGWLNPAEIPIAPSDRDRQVRARRRNPGPNRKGDGQPR